MHADLSMAARGAATHHPAFLGGLNNKPGDARV
jgi:hypothetical protein